MPIGILGSLLICTILYVMVSVVLTGIVSYKELNVSAPIALAINKCGAALMWLRPLIKIGAIAGLSSVILVMLLGQPRIFYTMAVDGLLPKVLTKIHPRFHTPYVTTIIVGVIAAFFAGFLPLDILSQLVSIGTLLAFVIVCGSIIVLAKSSTRYPPFIQNAMGSICSYCRYGDLFCTDVCASCKYMGTIDYLDGNRLGGLLPLWVKSTANSIQ